MRRWFASLLLAACVACSPGTSDKTPDSASASPTDRRTTTQKERTSPSQQSPDSSSPAEEEREPTTPSTPSPSLSLPPGLPEVPGLFDEEGNFDFEAFQKWLEKQPGGGAENGTGESCNPLSSTCLYDPLWGSCEWDYWRGLYVCNGPFHREGYDCYLDLWWDQYVCRPPN